MPALTPSRRLGFAQARKRWCLLPRATIVAGVSNDAIARKLFVSNKTVRNTVSGIYAKLHANGRAEAIVKARESGFGRNPDS